MPYFLDVGAQRVQEWILTTPELKLLRGASKALSSVTSTAALQGWVNSELTGCSIDPRLNDKDGVVVLTCVDAEAARRAATLLPTYLSSQLPRLSWAGWWAEADTYLAAYLKAERGEADVGTFTVSPPVYDVPVLAQCEKCRQEPRSSTGLGADCAARRRYADERDIHLARVPGHAAEHFADLADNGGLASGADRNRALGRRDSRNHLALVKADGNRIGQLFATLAEDAARLPTLSAHAISDLNAATIVAVESAAEHPGVSDVRAKVKGVLPHYIGGDDVLVSVPAMSGWRFAAELGRQFAELQDTWLRRLEHDLEDNADATLRQRLVTLIDRVSLGIGLVFAHASHPIALSHIAAEAALRASKRWTRGAQSAIAWVDLTAEGLAGAQDRGEWRQVITAWEARKELDGTTAGSESAAELFTVSPSGRARLGQELRDADTVALQRLVAMDWCRSTGHTGALLELADEHPERILPLLSRARWWPNSATEEEER